MKSFAKQVILYGTVIALAVACSTSEKNSPDNQTSYTPAHPELYKTILSLDSAFFAAYNTCAVNLETYADFYADTLEFFHDQNGLSTSKSDIVAGTRKYICGKVTRELVKGSVEVHEIKNYGAIEIGLHTFHNKEEAETSQPGRFIIFWKQTGTQWKITKVVSLH